MQTQGTTGTNLNRVCSMGGPLTSSLEQVVADQAPQAATGGADQESVLTHMKSSPRAAQAIIQRHASPYAPEQN